MGRLNYTQKQGLGALLIMGLLFTFIAFIHMLIALASYKRKGAFFLSFFLAFVFFAIAGVLMYGE